ncbi:MAG: tryptophanase [Acholeplasmatales bacterium]|jgi:tryptophanase|nr:tryptophanase [Acholeplasmataceae bacterium]MDY0115510.1 tryptophanase [Acholeplasmatales bacterium]
MDKKYVAEPYRIKMVEPLFETTKEERIKLLKSAGYNPFALRSHDVYVDLLTDSGTGAMSQEQWSMMMLGDEAYAGSSSFYRLEKVVKEITGYQYFIPAHQGRGAEKVLLPQLVTKENMYYISNTHFDTTRAHVELAGARALDCVIDECFDLDKYHDFKGNMDLVKLEHLINEKGKENIAGIIMTVTNNSAGGQPVSMENIRKTSEICQKYQLKLIIDGARFSENSYFIKTREKGYQNKTIKEIALEMFGYADVFLMSAKKDALVNMGGIIAIKNDRELFLKAQTMVVPYEGFPSYGGLSGRDMEALAVGLKEGMEEDYLKHRLDQVRYLGEKLKAAGVPIQYPVGGHAVFVECKSFCPHIPFYQFPALAVTNELYLEAGVRAVEIGSLLLGRDPDTKENLESKMEFMRLTIPRRVYTYNHLDVVALGVINVYEKRKELKGYTFLEEAPILRHFTSTFKPVE